MLKDLANEQNSKRQLREVGASAVMRGEFVEMTEGILKRKGAMHRHI
jgi:hypothetical protein